MDLIMQKDLSNSLVNLYRSILKRIIDIVFSFCFILIASPLMIAAGILIKISSRGPIFFKQERAGENGKPFTVYKFRTMTDKPRKVDREIYKGDSEVTSVGLWLRRFKIDELPQLINILKGDMSIVGPRPGMMTQITKLDENGKFRLKVKPGLTGLAQVHGNIHLSWPERWIYDRKYVENLSFFLDVKILVKTIMIVLFGEEKFLKKPNV